MPIPEEAFSYMPVLQGVVLTDKRLDQPRALFVIEHFAY